ncbi:hypothetical protein phiAS5_ORF0126 [Aeromonas phage phiAS5]|uniref:Uncharacterized protein n=1 Tax=Aeromonas phage phiAS5 TaxID=879630 RepID=E1A2M3_9CAUD|nr:hypothetical protein phiAS5_ORF0126 [Aeromonas phage phiAS5]ADM79969.1 hypothetical protein phiAS5_ORF0126 [Aeromonas phage phiAS5]
MTMKLTVPQMYDLIRKSICETSDQYRFGQALFNNLPTELADSIRGTDKDFFYWDNKRQQEIIQYCYDHMTFSC